MSATHHHRFGGRPRTTKGNSDALVLTLDADGDHVSSRLLGDSRFAPRRVLFRARSAAHAAASSGQVARPSLDPWSVHAQLRP